MTRTGSDDDATWDAATPWPGWTRWLGQVPLLAGEAELQTQSGRTRHLHEGDSFGEPLIAFGLQAG
jgi:hypothetical protein